MAVLLPDERHVWCLPKTSCAFIEKALKEVAGGTRVFQQHTSAREFKGERTAPHYGTTVDPWTWYPRLWRHATMDGTRPNGRVARYAHGEIDAISMWSIEFSRWEDFFWGVLAMTPQRAQPDYELILVSCEGAPELKREGGLWSWGNRFMYQREGVWLIDGLLDGHRPSEALVAIGVDASGREPYNTLNTREWYVNTKCTDETPIITHYANWYTPKMIEAVWESDGDLIRELGYIEPFCPSLKGPHIRVDT